MLQPTSQVATVGKGNSPFSMPTVVNPCMKGERVSWESHSHPKLWRN